MATSQHELARAALVTALATAVAPVVVERNRDAVTDLGATPDVVIVRDGDVSVVGEISPQGRHYAVDVAVEMLCGRATEAAARLACDARYVDAMVGMLADRTLGGRVGDVEERGIRVDALDGTFTGTGYGIAVDLTLHVATAHNDPSAAGVA